MYPGNYSILVSIYLVRSHPVGPMICRTSLGPSAGLLIISEKQRLEATHIIGLKMQAQCYQSSMIVSRVALFTSMVDAIGF